jgi:hypothetical protein
MEIDLPVPVIMLFTVRKSDEGARDRYYIKGICRGV